MAQEYMDASEPRKVTPSMSGSNTQSSSIKSPTGGTPLSGKATFESTPMHDSMPTDFGIPPHQVNPFAFPGALPPMMPYMEWHAHMGKGMPMPMMHPMMQMGYPGMGYPGMAYPGMGYPPAQGGKNQNRDQGGNKDKTRRRGARNKNKNKDNEEAAEVDDSTIVRSPELTEVRRAGQGKSSLALKDVMEQVVEFSSDQYGSRFVQNEMDSANETEKAAVLQTLLPHANKLAKDQYGNFVIQKLFDVGTPEQRKEIANTLLGEVASLSMDQHGCRVIQKAITQLPRESQMKLAMELQDTTDGADKVRECIENMHGNHVIQKCIEQMPPDSVNFIIESVNKSVNTMAEHMYGCRVIQRLLEHCAPHQLQDMLAKIRTHTTELAKHLYGNYVVQHMLEHGREEDKKAILDAITSHIIEFAKSKCSSNVVEKCFEIASIGEHADALKEQRQNLYRALLTPQPGLPMPLKQLTDDKFGNYIVQRMIEYSKEPERSLLHQQLLTLIPELSQSPNGRHICTAISKEFNIPVPTTSDEQ